MISEDIKVVHNKFVESLLIRLVVLLTFSEKGPLLEVFINELDWNNVNNATLTYMLWWK